VQIQSPPAAPEPTDVAKLFEVLGRQVFADITGLAGTQANAAATYRQNLETALAFGKEASELAKQAGMLSAKDRAFDAIDTAESEGKINADEARDLRLSALRKMVGDSGSARRGGRLREEAPDRRRRRGQGRTGGQLHRTGARRDDPRQPRVRRPAARTGAGGRGPERSTSCRRTRLPRSRSPAATAR
jgi:hypothetical protein